MEFEIINNKDILPAVNYNTFVIPVIDTNILYKDFFRSYLQPNLPCIIKNVTDQWESTQHWVKEGKPNFEYLQEKYGNCEVTIYNCSRRYFNSQETEQTTFSKYIKYWQTYITKNSESSPLHYLKDWHLKNENRHDNFYKVPIYFASDWLNEYFTECLKDDYRFVYMGPKNTWTPFHADVFTSYSWSVNLCGQKRWCLFPPGEEEHLRDKLNNLPYDIKQITHSRKYYEVIQNSGEAIFVPSSWHHQVWNLDNTISVNHNWINGCNIQTIYLAIMNNLKSVKTEIDDCKDMDNFEEHCQVMLNSTFGMDYYKFYELIEYIALKRIQMIKDTQFSRTLFHGHIIGRHHILFDLNAIKNVLQVFIKCDDVNKLNYFNKLDVSPCSLLTQILKTLDNT